MKYTHIPIQLITSKGNVRKCVVQGSISELAASLKSIGQQVAILGYQDGEWLVLIDGHMRLEAAKQLGWDKLQACVLERAPSPAELRIAQLSINGRRQDVNPVDVFETLKELVEVHGQTQTQLATSLGQLPDKITKLLSLGKLTADQRELVRSGKLPLSTAYHISRLGTAERDVFIQKALSGELTRDQVQAKVRRKKPSAEQPKCRRISCVLPSGTLNASMKDGVTLPAFYELLMELSKHVRKAISAGWDPRTFSRVLEDGARNEVPTPGTQGESS